MYKTNCCKCVYKTEYLETVIWMQKLSFLWPTFSTFYKMEALQLQPKSLGAVVNLVTGRCCRPRSMS